MKHYFQNVLKGFLPTDGAVVLEPMMRANPEFILIDVDMDDMPEIVFAMEYDNQKKVGILKRFDMKWYLDDVSNSRDGLNTGIYSVLEPLKQTRLDENNLGQQITIEELFEAGMTQFISMIDGKLYYGKVEFAPVPMLPGDDGSLAEGEQIVVDFDQADIKGNDVMYRVYLLGEGELESAVGRIDNLVLQVELPLSEQVQTINLPTTSGYSPYLFIGDFTGDGTDEIMVNIFSTPTGGMIYSYIYELKGEEPRLIFDSTKFNKQSKGNVKYLKNYRVRVKPKLLSRKYFLDIRSKDKAYLREIYDRNGQLIEEEKGEILGVVAVNPVDYDANKIFNIGTIQPITGKDSEDLLALLETFMRWNAETEEFEAFMQYVSLLGEMEEEVEPMPINEANF